jgi:virginiamycin A acetyltransferase
MPVPDPNRIYPPVYGPNYGRAQGWPAVFLKPLVESAFTEVGEYTYYADPVDPTGFERNNVLFHYGPDKLVIGKYTAIAREVRFLMGAANHLMNGISTYPFPMFGADWMAEMDSFAARSFRGDTVVGNDVWLGYQALVMPGVTIGDGAIVAARSVVAADLPPYCIAAGNPARVVRMRFTDEQIARLRRIAWWNWPGEHVTRHLDLIMGDDLDTLEAAAPAPVESSS